MVTKVVANCPNIKKTSKSTGPTQDQASLTVLGRVDAVQSVNTHHIEKPNTGRNMSTDGEIPGQNALGCLEWKTYLDGLYNKMI